MCEIRQGRKPSVAEREANEEQVFPLPQRPNALPHDVSRVQGPVLPLRQHDRAGPIDRAMQEQNR